MQEKFFILNYWAILFRFHQVFAKKSALIFDTYRILSNCIFAG